MPNNKHIYPAVIIRKAVVLSGDDKKLNFKFVKHMDEVLNIALK